ncbi:MAG: DUF1592 domain-containing protein [Bryobacter sp.]|nr:DUF1592 domain-containing protein [Bryobacter sp.]
MCVRLFLFASIASLSAYAEPQALFKQSCLACHGKAAMGGINLQELLAAPSVGDHYDKWKKVALVLENNQMPPAKVKQPPMEAKAETAVWVRSRLREYALAHNGDPGRVTVRQLTAGEYNYAIEDLTGLKLQLERDSSADSVGGEGFTNYGDTQFMQDSTFERYLESAKRVASHAVVGSGPLQFFIDPGKSGLEYSAISRIRAIYEKHGFRASSGEGGKPYNLGLYGKVFYAVWAYQNRAALGQPKATLADFAAKEGVSTEFATHILATLQTPKATYPLTEAIALFQKMPAPGKGDARAAAKELQDFVINYPRWVFGAGAWAEGGRGDERNFLITNDSLQATTSGKLRGISRQRAGREHKFYLSVVNLNPKSDKPAAVEIRDANIRFTKRDRSASGNMPLLSALDQETKQKLGLGGDADAMKFSIPAGAVVPIAVKAPEGVLGVGITLEAVLPKEYPEAVLRVTVSDAPTINAGVPNSAILGFEDNPGYRLWKKNVLAYSNAMPQNSHAEATPADKDPIPPPFNNTYNQPERDTFHVKVKYHRDDSFLATKVLDATTRRALDQAWNDLLGSFEYHDAYFSFVKTKFNLSALAKKPIESLSAADIAAIPAEPRQYVARLKKEADAVDAAFLRAQPGHVEDALAFAERAWRRPLTAGEKDTLRRFYTRSRTVMKLDHDKAVRALLARILVSPAFLYRIETNSGPRLSTNPKGVARLRPVAAPVSAKEILLAPYELASRLSFFLWSSIPDQELRRAAAAGELNEPKNIAAQVKRMLADPKARRLAPELFGQWLGYYGFDHYSGVDSSRFPEFNEDLKRSLYEEANHFFDHLIRQGRPLREMFAADYTFLNKRLAEHYGVKADVPADGSFQKVDNLGQYNRGGFLGFGAVHATTSAPLRTSPVKRGNFLLSRVFGTPTPPPPPDAGMLPADDKKFAGETIRERLIAHQRNATCAGCHARIDHLGFPLEKFDPIGRWREKYDNGQAIYDIGDVSETKKIPGIAGLKQHLSDKEKLVLGNFARKTLGFALGRTVQGSDDPLLEEVAEGGGEQTFADLAVRIAISKQFRYRRADSPDQPQPAAVPAQKANVDASKKSIGGL